MLTELKCYPLLDGWRGAAPCDQAAVVNVIVRLGRLLGDLPEIAEIDCNPVICGPSGASVVDCRLRIAPAPPADVTRHLSAVTVPGLTVRP